MSGLHSLRNVLVDSPNSLGAKFRLRRWSLLRSAFPDIDEMSVLDLGGRVETWRRAPIRPAHVHVVNLERAGGEVDPRIEVSEADACRLPAEIRVRSYDLVFSNAVLEHVGGHARRIEFADTVHEMAARHWIQTPYRYFPIEPHWLFPGFQFLPVIARTRVSQVWPLVHTPDRNSEHALRSVLEVELISKSELRFYFPDSRIVSENLGPLIKSIIAVRG